VNEAESARYADVLTLAGDTLHAGPLRSARTAAQRRVRVWARSVFGDESAYVDVDVVPLVRVVCLL
jgi:hypothetical protein